MESIGASLRLSKDVFERYSAEAVAQSLPLGTLLRRYLERQYEVLAGELAALRRAIEEIAAAPGATGDGSSPAPRGALLEMLLLLRLLAGPQRATMVQKEVERLGLETWRL